MNIEEKAKELAIYVFCDLDHELKFAEDCDEEGPCGMVTRSCPSEDILERLVDREEDGAVVMMALVIFKESWDEWCEEELVDYFEGSMDDYERYGVRRDDF